MIKLELPLPFYKKNSKALMTMNVFRNLNHHLLNKFKVEYGNMLKDIISSIDPITEPIALVYEFHFVGRKKIDLVNVGCAVDKVFSDCLVELGIIQDDSIGYLKKVTFIGSLGHYESKCYVYIKEAE